MSEELFNIPETKSPRLKWKERHRIQTRQSDPESVGQEDEKGDTIEAWYAAQTGANASADWKNDRTYGGATEDEAMVNLAKARGFKSWTEEDAR